jgi:diaminohydroxyphosphoribosylaminopyrimidine deaminase / 5-amino-6-(5-phosphoribosylamino)uracil reductase
MTAPGAFLSVNGDRRALSDQKEKQWMLRALELAARGRGQTSPNPMVGAVLVQDGRVVGEGWHHQAGQPHAEALALRRAGKRARGAVLFVNLEPCSHFGRTPPCADALIQAGIARAVVAMRDPDPRVSGRGINRLRRAGITVEVGLLREAAAGLNEVFLHRARSGSPFVSLKLAQSLDGAIAAGPGLRTGISSALSRRFAMRLRAMHDSILVGVSTVLADDPLLNVRGVPGARQPLRVVLDSALKLPTGSRLVSTAGQYPTLVLYDQSLVQPRRASALEALGVRTCPVGGAADGILPLTGVLDILGSRGVCSVLVEGGRRVATSFLAERLVQRLHLFIAPSLYGEGGPLHGIGPVGAANGFPLRLTGSESRRIGPDLYLTGRLKYPRE